MVSQLHTALKCKWVLNPYYAIKILSGYVVEKDYYIVDNVPYIYVNCIEMTKTHEIKSIFEKVMSYH